MSLAHEAILRAADNGVDEDVRELPKEALQRRFAFVYAEGMLPMVLQALCRLFFGEPCFGILS